MNINKLTQKSVTAVQEAQSIATKKGSSQVDQQHLMAALLEQELISQLITRMGKDREAFGAALEKEINRLPRMSGSRTSAVPCRRTGPFCRTNSRKDSASRQKGIR